VIVVYIWSAVLSALDNEVIFATGALPILIIQFLLELFYREPVFRVQLLFFRNAIVANLAYTLYTPAFCGVLMKIPHG
jgi:hypothetical protein